MRLKGSITFERNSEGVRMRIHVEKHAYYSQFGASVPVTPTQLEQKLWMIIRMVVSEAQIIRGEQAALARIRLYGNY